MRLFTFERRVVVQQLLTGVVGGLERVVVRLQKHRRQHGWTCPQSSPSLCSRSWWLERGPYSCLAMMKMKVKHIHTCDSHCCIINCRTQPLLLNAPFLHHQHGRDGPEALGPGAAWLGDTEAVRTGALHRRR